MYTVSLYVGLLPDLRGHPRRLHLHFYSLDICLLRF